MTDLEGDFSQAKGRPVEERAKEWIETIEDKEVRELMRDALYEWQWGGYGEDL